MAGKSKSVHFSVVDSKTHKTVMQRTFFNASDVKKFIKEQDIEVKYPKPTFYLVKEVY